MSLKRPSEGAESSSKRTDGVDLPSGIAGNQQTECWVDIYLKQDRDAVKSLGGPCKVLDVFISNQLRYADTTRKMTINGLRAGRIPETLLTSFPHIHKLVLNSMSLRSVPSVASLPNLKLLALADNLLTEMPSWICGLTRLTTLYLNKNRLTSLRATDLGALTALERLHCHHNLLDTIESGIFPHLQRLESLTIYNNKLRHNSFPADMAQCPIKSLDIHNNNLSRLMPGDFFPRALSVMQGVGHQLPFGAATQLSCPYGIPPNLTFDFCSMHLAVVYGARWDDCTVDFCNSLPTSSGDPPVSTAIAVRQSTLWLMCTRKTCFARVPFQTACVLWEMQRPGCMLTEWLVHDVFAMIVQFVRGSDEVLPRLPQVMNIS